MTYQLLILLAPTLALVGWIAMEKIRGEL